MAAGRRWRGPPRPKFRNVALPGANCGRTATALVRLQRSRCQYCGPMVSPAPLRVLVVDDDERFRDLLTSLLAPAEDVQVVGRAASGEQAITRAAELHPDVVLMDLQMPGMGGVAATGEIVRADPRANVLVLTVMADVATIVSALRAGARGYLLKGVGPGVLAEHVRATAAGGGALAPAVARVLVESVALSLGGRGRPYDSLPPPTTGELDVLKCLAAGMDTARTAKELNVAHGTVKARLLSLARRWNVTGRVQILMAATRAGYVS